MRSSRKTLLVVIATALCAPLLTGLFLCATALLPKVLGAAASGHPLNEAPLAAMFIMLFAYWRFVLPALAAGLLLAIQTHLTGGFTYIYAALTIWLTYLAGLVFLPANSISPVGVPEALMGSCFVISTILVVAILKRYGVIRIVTTDKASD